MNEKTKEQDNKNEARPSVSEGAHDRLLSAANQSEFTPGPWEWVCNHKTKSIYLATEGRGRLYVMGFERYGMRGAAPSFCNTDKEPRIIKRADEWGDKPDHNGYYGINNADAKLIAAAPDLYKALKTILVKYREDFTHSDIMLMEDALKKAVGKNID